jgi:hypothetical protein
MVPQHGVAANHRGQSQLVFPVHATDATIMLLCDAQLRSLIWVVFGFTHCPLTDSESGYWRSRWSALGLCWWWDSR